MRTNILLSKIARNPASRPLVELAPTSMCPLSKKEEGHTTQTTTRLTSFLNSFVYPHSHDILELAVLLKSNKAFEEFTQAILAFLMNAQMVDLLFVINPLNPNSKEKSITLKGEISSYMTKLGFQVKISGNRNAFKKQKFWPEKTTVEEMEGRLVNRTKRKSLKTLHYIF
jgi:hypothetical protein